MNFDKEFFNAHKNTWLDVILVSAVSQKSSLWDLGLAWDFGLGLELDNIKWDSEPE